MLIGVPVSLGIAIFLTEICPQSLRRTIGIAIELLAGIPSIIYGIWGLFVFAPWFQVHVQPFLIDTFAEIPVLNQLFAGPPYGIGMLTAGLILAIMVLPFITSYHDVPKPHYRGWDGANANHNQNWHDSIHDSVGNPCGNDSPEPCDDFFHGTHTIATAVGDDGGTNQVGMAPGAQWIGCRNMDEGNGTPARYIECMEFFIAPYPLGCTPNEGDPAKAPDITNNSWGCPPSEGCAVNTLQAAVEAQGAAGIQMVVSAGNSGPGCSTVSIHLRFMRLPTR